MQRISFISFVAFLIVFFVLVTDSVSAAPIAKRSTKKYTGTATWFKPASEGGSTGACGPKEGDNSLIVALNKKQYGNMSAKSKWCGKKIKVKGPKGSMTVKVNDACPECKYGDLDLTPRVFKKVVGDMDIGVAKITWYEV
ncbi:RlpA-like double-psi beta-barrel-protein domain-containing protein-containing protein [Syncephalastrum racemosum]|uniref:RlpA-like double-psi beta-barrel-protein domain-containing protein-containing protein n=1 Tax=Syncephalastrum racemosum TaxID=13706 RepID=A0A1X2HA03_SYNRA|nr:RlpA-like double-psi beta-barrel-protein domain-containing protein-containing protein [Syncephalastrum racemosum]